MSVCFHHSHMKATRLCFFWSAFPLSNPSNLMTSLLYSLSLCSFGETLIFVNSCSFGMVRGSCSQWGTRKHTQRLLSSPPDTTQICRRYDNTALGTGWGPVKTNFKRKKRNWRYSGHFKSGCPCLWPLSYPTPQSMLASYCVAFSTPLHPDLPTHGYHSPPSTDPVRVRGCVPAVCGQARACSKYVGRCALQSNVSMHSPHGQ